MAFKTPPYGYIHPTKATPAGEQAEQRSQPAAPLSRGSKTAQLPHTDASDDAIESDSLLGLEQTPRSTRVRAPATIVSTEFARIAISFPIIGTGRNIQIDQMRDAKIDERTICLAIGTRALAAFEASSFPLEPSRSVELSGSFHTNRRLSQNRLREAKAALDPFAVLSARQFGIHLGTAIVERWIEAEQKLVS